MAELPENLLIPKIELTTPPLTPTTSHGVTQEQSANIKERLNLHVKRRLQQELPQQHTEQVHQQQETQVQNARKEKQKDAPAKTRRPYQKRADKIKQLELGGTSGSAAVTVRKYKRQKVRQQQQQQQQLQVNSNVVGNAVKATVSGNVVRGGSAVSDEGTQFENNADDEGSQDGVVADGEVRAGTTTRDKDKCPDVLGMVLSMKKRALLQNPEVQEFLQKIMQAIKN